MLQDQEREWSQMGALVVDASHFERNLSIEQLRTIGFGRVFGVSSVEGAWPLLMRTNPDVLGVDRKRR